MRSRPGFLRYRCGSGSFALFESAGAAAGNLTQMGWEVADIEATVAALRARGVVFEEYDLPGLKTVDVLQRFPATIRAKVAVRRAPVSGTAKATCSASANLFAD